MTNKQCFIHTGITAEVDEFDGRELSVDMIPFRSGGVVFMNLAIVVLVSRCSHPVKQRTRTGQQGASTRSGTEQ